MDAPCRNSEEGKPLDAARKEWMREAIRLARAGMQKGGGGPFGALVVCDGQFVGRGFNQVTLLLDPTAHAEMTAIREACRELGRFELRGCDLYGSCEPCPMCLSAIYWARIDRVYYACTRADAAIAGFDDDFHLRPDRARRLRAIAADGAASFLRCSGVVPGMVRQPGQSSVLKSSVR